MTLTVETRHTKTIVKSILSLAESYLADNVYIEKDFNKSQLC